MKKFLIMIITVCCVGIMTLLQVFAEEESQDVELMQMMTATQKVEARQEPDENAEVVFVYEKNAKVFIVEETTDGWYKVFYQGRNGYVRKDGLVLQETDIAALDKEMEVSAAEGKMVIEEVERYRAEMRRSRIWGTVIVLLVAGIFAIGIITARKQKA